MKKIKYVIKIAWLFFTCLFFTGNIIGCGTMMTGRYNEITISTNPSNAKIIDDSGKVLAVTPAKLTIKKTKQPKLRFIKEGFHDSSIVIQRSLSLFPIAQMASWASWYFVVPADGKTPLNWAKFGAIYGGAFYIADLLLGGAWVYKPDYASGEFGSKKKLNIQMKKLE